MARVNPAMITADMVDAATFPRLSERFQVYSVPVTVVNGSEQQVGAVPENRLAQVIKKALGM
ncbi:hypothetical protein TPY_3334 [Sulfobacillus acidophilus TPY]|nr:hypothetical protein TPY_3334 [Sulfobacillus acidophilus TPY]